MRGGISLEGKDLLFELSNSFGVTGNEYNLSGTLGNYFKEYTDEIITAKRGDFVALKKGSGQYKVMIAAHADEVGLMVKDIDSRGFIYFTSVGGVDAKTLPAQEVIIHGRSEVYGVIGAKPPHVLTAEEMKKAISMEDMMIDVGMTKEISSKIISIGDFITVRRSCKALLGDFITGKALDDRAGICTMFECAKELQKIKHSADVYFAATTMEETGGSGVRTVAYEINPDVGIVVDVTFADRYANSDIPAECGKGIEIDIGPNMHPELSDRLIKIAEEYNIPYCIDVYPGHTGTDAWNLQIAREGIPTVLIGVPLKYMHTSTEVISYKDIKAAGRLMALFIASLKDWRDVYDS